MNDLQGVGQGQLYTQLGVIMLMLIHYPPISTVEVRHRRSIQHTATQSLYTKNRRQSRPNIFPQTTLRLFLQQE
jgi:hypothetical protein